MMERFVVAILSGGIALVTGLWLGTLLATLTIGWLVGVLFAVVGVVSLAWGIMSELSVNVPGP